MKAEKYLLPTAVVVLGSFLLLTLVASTPTALANSSNAAPAVANWVTNGNSVGNKDFIGTTNNKALVFKTNKVEQMRILSNGNIGIGTKTPGSKLTVNGLVESTSGGFKFPDGTTQTTANTDGASGWGLGGNAGTNPANNFVGTTDNQPLILRTKGFERLRISTDGNIGIGTSATDVRLLIHTPSGYPGWRHSDGVTTLGSYLGTRASSATGGWLGTVSNHDLHFFTNNGEPSQTLKTNGNVGIGTANPTSKLEIAAQDGLAITGYQPFLTLRDTTSNARGRIQSANGDVFFWSNSFIGGNPPLALKNNSGNVGIGTAAPAQSLEVNGVTSMGQAGGVYGYRVSGGGLSYPTLGFNTYGPLGGGSYLAGATGHGSLFQYQNSDGKLIYYTGTSVSAGAARALTARFAIDASGNVGIGTPNPTAKVHIVGPDTSSATPALLVQNGGVTALSVEYGTVKVRTAGGESTSHACLDVVAGNLRRINSCSSAAEYVPTTDGGNGFPQTADLVSIAPNVKNPYGDEHGPFTVQKSATPCDANLLGFIVKPESGADGKKLNDHYLPLAIYGYFPAKVTTANGTIKRGDALTSSSKAGYAMKATGACKIIGYALEDATSDGEIQVFADLGENSATQVAQLQTQVNTLTQENIALKKMLAEMDARLKALEYVSPVVRKASESE